MLSSSIMTLASAEALGVSASRLSSTSARRGEKGESSAILFADLAVLGVASRLAMLAMRKPEREGSPARQLVFLYIWRASCTMVVYGVWVGYVFTTRADPYKL